MTVPIGRLIILGNNITALAVVRAARKHGLEPILFDFKPGVAFKTALAEKILCESADDKAVLAHLMQNAQHDATYLIAAGDEWIQFIIRNRQNLDKGFKKVLHAENKSLSICINKIAFAEFCQEHDLTAPQCYDISDPTQLHGISFPVILRPVGGQCGPATGIPKAVHIESSASLAEWQSRFNAAGVAFVVTESLLGHRLTKFSVAVARSHSRIISFVAEQIRPQPAECAVGTYVKLRPNQEAEALARRLVCLLDYYGIGEIEILYSHDVGKYYLIEFNARPWLQYSLAEDTNHCLLQFLLKGEEYQPPGVEMKTGKGWKYFTGDFHVCFSRSIGYLRKGHVTWPEYLRSMSINNSSAFFSWHDPLPALHSLCEWCLSIFRNRLKLR